LGSRYGGLKQMDPVGPQGGTILDYSLHDARRAGFGRVVFVIRRDFADEFRRRVGEPHARRGLDVRYAFQEPGDLPGGFTPPVPREKPWGTGHAVWCARAEVGQPFAVVNADDFYGADSFRQLAGYLRAADPSAADFALVGFRLGHTLSEHGTVARGVCRVDASGLLLGLEEQTALEPDPAGGARARQPDGAFRHFSADSLVSMNCWAFTPALFPLLDGELEKFLAVRGADPRAEFYLPAAVGALADAGRARVRVLPTAAHWCGVTYRDDRPAVQAALQKLHDAGEYADLR
jgi:hypothetical protein